MTPSNRITHLLLKVAGTAYLPTKDWLKTHIAATNIDINVDNRRALQLRRAYPELNYADAEFLKLWAMYESLVMFSSELKPTRDIGFVHFILGLPKVLPKIKPMTTALAARADTEGERIEQLVAAQ